MTNKKPHLRTGSLIFCVGQCRNGDGSGGGTIFDAEFAQDAFDVLPDRSGACAEDHADLFKSYMFLVGQQREAASRITPGGTRPAVRAPKTG